MKELYLFNHRLTELTESDLIALCKLNGFEPNDLSILYLNGNKLTNLNFMTKDTPFVNLIYLNISDNFNITDISNIQYLKELIELNIGNLVLKNKYKTLKIINNLSNLNRVLSYNTFKSIKNKKLKFKLIEL